MSKWEMQLVSDPIALFVVILLALPLGFQELPHALKTNQNKQNLWQEMNFHRIAWTKET